jgi:hypothetical protein
VEMCFVRARAGAHDVVVIAYDDQTPTYEDGAPEHRSCIVIDGARRGDRCAPPRVYDPAAEADELADPDQGLTLGGMLGAAPPPTEADTRALLRAAVLAEAHTTHVAWDSAGREAASARWGRLADMLAAIPVGMHSGASGTGARAFVAIQDEYYFGWRAKIERYDVWLDAQGRVHEHVETLLESSGSHRGHDPPWQVAAPP